MTRFYDQATKRGSQLATEILDFDWLMENVFCPLDETTVRFFVVKLTTSGSQYTIVYETPYIITTGNQSLQSTAMNRLKRESV